MLRESGFGWLAVAVLAAHPLGAAEVVFQPELPTRDDVVRIEIRGCSQAGTLHWGVNARGNQWQKAIEAYRPPGSAEDGIAARTPLSGPDSQGVCRVELGPFNNTNQPVSSVDLALQWADGTWDTAGGGDYHVRITQARIRFEPESPTLNNAVTVTVRRSAPGGLLRWGVNAVYGLWSRPDTNYWPAGSVPSDDGLAVDTPLGPPDANGESTLVLGPFNLPGQVVTSLHTAAHWRRPAGAKPDDWDTDLGRNYSVNIALVSVHTGPVVRLLSPQDGQCAREALPVRVQLFRADAVTLWLDGEPLGSLMQRPFECTLFDTNVPSRCPLPMGSGAAAFGRHTLTARAESGGLAGIARAEFWRVPPFLEQPLPEGARPGAAADGDLVTFVLHAPGKRFVSVVGDFNGWNPLEDVMNLAPGGTWWLQRRLEPGTHAYQYAVDGETLIADPCARDVEWKDEEGRETHVPEKAFSILQVGAPPFAWTDQAFRRAPLEDLVIYEFAIDDLCPGQGFTGVIAKLDMIRGLGVTAIEPLPVTEFPGGWSWGYNPAFHGAPESTYGTPDDLRRLVNEAHARGLAVIFDMVFNHMDWNSALFQLYGQDYGASPYFWLFLGDNWGFPDLEQESEDFKRYAGDMLRVWLEEYHADGFRYDATRWVGWQGYNDWGASWLAYAAKQADPTSYQIAEHLPADPQLQAQTEMDTGWHGYYRWRLRDMILNARLERAEFEKVMDARRLGFSNSFERVAYLESHDEERLVRELTQAGFPEDEALRRAGLGLAVLFTTPGAVMVYAGEEFGEATPKILGRNPLHWSNLEKPSYRRLRDTFSALAHLRTSHPALRTENIAFQTEGVPGDVAVYERCASNGCVVVAANFGREEQKVSVALPGPGPWRNVVDPQESRAGETNVVLPLRPGGFVVLEGGEPPGP